MTLEFARFADYEYNMNKGTFKHINTKEKHLIVYYVVYSFSELTLIVLSWAHTIMGSKPQDCSLILKQLK